jgi:phage portal protein BeeE
VVHRAVRLVAAAASLPLTLLGRGRALDAHPLLDLLRRPNAREGGARFLESVYGHFLVSGNAFYTTKRVGGGVQDYDAIKLLKFAV